MTALAKKLDEHFQKLDSTTLKQLDDLFMRLLTVFEKRAARLPGRSQEGGYKLRKRSLGVRKDLDLTKLAHFDEDFE